MNVDQLLSVVAAHSPVLGNAETAVRVECSSLDDLCRLLDVRLTPPDDPWQARLQPMFFGLPIVVDPALGVGDVRLVMADGTVREWEGL